MFNWNPERIFLRVSLCLLFVFNPAKRLIIIFFSYSVISGFSWAFDSSILSTFLAYLHLYFFIVAVLFSRYCRHLTVEYSQFIPPNSVIELSLITFIHTLWSPKHCFLLLFSAVINYIIIIKNGLPWCLRWERNCLQCRGPRFNACDRKITWRRECLPTPVFLPGEFHGQRMLDKGHDPEAILMIKNKKNYSSFISSWLLKANFV